MRSSLTIGAARAPSVPSVAVVYPRVSCAASPQSPRSLLYVIPLVQWRTIEPFAQRLHGSHDTLDLGTQFAGIRLSEKGGVEVAPDIFANTLSMTITAPSSARSRLRGPLCIGCVAHEFTFVVLRGDQAARTAICASPVR